MNILLINHYAGSLDLGMEYRPYYMAKEWINKAIEIDKSHCLMVNLGRNYASYSEFFKQKKDWLKARENMEKAIKILKDCGADGWVGKYEKELAEL